jgi:hypothetical protein
MPDAAQAPYPAQVLLLPPDFHLGTEGPLVAVATTEAAAFEVSWNGFAVVRSTFSFVGVIVTPFLIPPSGQVSASTNVMTFI